MKLQLVAHAALLLLPLAAGAQAKKAGDPVTFDTVSFVGDVRPGSNIVAVLNFKVAKGYSIPGNRPVLRGELATLLGVTAPPTMRILPADFPGGVPKQVQVPGVAQPVTTMYYEDSFALRVPVILGPNVVLPATLPATLQYQPAQGATKQPVRRLQFEVKLPKAEPPPKKK
jgi:hypothetical protein